MPEVLLPGAEQRADRGEAREVAAELVVVPVRAHHHHHRVPAADRADALLERDVARGVLLHMRSNRVDVRGVRRERDVRARAACLVNQPLEQIMRALRAFTLEHCLERVEPFLGLERVGIVGGGKLRHGGHGGLGVSNLCCGWGAKLNQKMGRVLDCAPLMAARILDGKSLAAQVRAAVKNEVAALSQRGIRPGLAVLLAGDNAASRVYVRNKVRASEETGVRSERYELPASVSEEAVLDRVLALNDDPDVHGILVQLPLP